MLVKRLEPGAHIEDLICPVWAVASKFTADNCVAAAFPKQKSQVPPGSNTPYRSMCALSGQGRPSPQTDAGETICAR